MKKLSLLVAVLAAQGCASPVIRIEPVPATETISRLCIKENPKTYMEDFLPEVRAQLMKADVVIPSLDAGDEVRFRAINRPHPQISFDQMVNGLMEFRREYKGQYWLEVFLLEGYTAIQAEVEKYVREELLPKMKAEFDGASIEIETGAAAPALEASEETAITQLVRALTEDRATRKVAYGTEAGLFQGIGIPTVVCGPGHIEQAHKPNEYVALDQLAACETFLRRMGQSL